MIEATELITFLLGTIAFSYILYYRKDLEAFPHCSLLLAGLVSLLAGWLFTLLEGLISPATFNLLEHLCIATGSVLVAVWCRLAFHFKSVPDNDSGHNH